MPTTCVIVSKVLVLQILLGLCAAAYEYGYHPSAEEFDSLMRETRKTWTRDLLANERRRAWTSRKQTADRRNGAGFYNYVPKYHYEKQTDRFSWPPGYVQKVHDRNDQQQSASSNIGASLDFSMYDDIVMKDPPTATVQHQQPLRVFVQNKPTFMETDDYEDYDSFQVKPYVTTNSPVKLKKQTATMATLLETSTASSLINTNKFAIPNLNKNRTQLPIFFTNPTTGIVYAITEVGKVQENSTQANDSIPIYVTKEQYDRDLFLQRKYYENSCRRKQSFNTSQASAISAPSNTTVRPKILHLQNSSNSPHILKKPMTVKLPTPPPPVTLQTTVNIRNDRDKLPPKRKKKLKTARRKKKKPIKRPGRKPVAPILKEPTFPKIILGTRTTAKPRESHENLATQLEKPADGMVFSKRPTISTTYPPLSAASSKLRNKENPYVLHKIRRRSVTNTRENKKQLLFTQNSTTNTWSPTVNAVYAVKNNRNSSLSQFNATKAAQNNLNAKELIKNSPNQPHQIPANVPVTALTNIATPFPKVAFTAPNPTTTKDMQTIQNFSLATARSAAKAHKTKKSKKQKQTKRKSSDSNYDYYFGLLDSGDEDLDDDDEDDEYDADEDDYYYSIKHTTPESPHATIEANEHNEHFADDSSNNLKEETPQLNSSSAEEGADYGAMDVENTIPDSQEIANEQHEIQVISNTKDTASKKRIRRRPPSSASSSNSVEEYDDDYADDTDSGGISSFFRMIFYPVQMVMSRLIDGIGGEKDSSAEETQQQQAFPTYTLYHNAINNNNKHEDNDIEAESEQGNSLSDWFSSWFGFNRRTKKIGSTTLAPPTVVTEEPSWFGSWFNYGDSRTTTEAASYEDYDDDYKWFLGWFDSKPKTKKRRSTTTTTTTSAPTPQIPILTIVDPMRNPQNWIGILAHHIINATSTSTHNPLFDAFTRATLTTTTENPDIPRKVTYDKYQIWRLKPQDDGQVKAIEDYKNSNDGSKLQWLKGPSLRGLNDVLVPPKMIIDFQGTLNFESIAHEVLIFDVGKVIEYEKSKEHYIYATTAYRPNKHSNNNNNHNKKSPQMTMSWNKYYEYDDILKYLESMRLRYPQMIELIHIGRSYEGRPLIIVKIESKQTSTSSAANALANRKKLKFKKKSGQANAVFIEAGTHGMEWIAPATSAWMISELVRIMKSNNSDSEQESIKNTTWYILPVLNPDGYVFSHEYDRFWKKSRSRHVSRPGGIITSAMTWLQQKKSPEKVCYGVDLDRNWQYQWGRRGSSKSPCNEIFAGPVAFSEPETKALSAFLIDNRKQIKLYISLQAYGQILSYPKKANESFNSDRMDDFLDVAMVGTDWLRKKGSKSRYKIDSTNDLIENRSGSSDAFAAYEVGVPFSYTLQLADNGVHGYLLPSSSIEPTARDAFEIITAMIDYI